MTLTITNEVAEFISISQFISGRSPFECVAYSVSLCYYAGKPGHDPTGTALDVADTAQSYYARLEGSNLASNTNGMSLQAEYTMLQGLGLHYYPLSINGNNAHDIAEVKSWVARGYPVIICGDETGMYDMDIGDIIPYQWVPSGEHCIVVSGIASDGNLLVRDTANIGPSGLRPDPRRYQANRMHLVSATAIVLPWMSNPQQNGDTLPLLQLTDPMGKYFVQVASTRWHCPQTNNDIAYAHLDFYRKHEGIFGLPRTGEIYLAQFPGTAIQVYERGIVAYDPDNKIPHEKPPGAGTVYLLHIDSGTGQQIIAKPLLAELQSQAANFQGQIKNLQSQITVLEEQNASLSDTSELQTKLASYETAIRTIINALLPVERDVKLV